MVGGGGGELPLVKVGKYRIRAEVNTGTNTVQIFGVSRPERAVKPFIGVESSTLLYRVHRMIIGKFLTRKQT